MFKTLRRPDVMIVTLAAAGILMVTMGIRQSLGLFISPMNSTTGLGITTISLALAIGQLTWGAIQPVAGAIADRYGPGRVLVAGLIVMALGCMLTPMIGSGFGLTVTIGLMMSMGSGASSFSTLIGAAANRMPPESRGEASGVINAGGSFGQFVFAPILQKLIQSMGWMGAMWVMAITALATIPLVARLRGQRTVPGSGSSPLQSTQSLKEALSEAMRDRSFWLLNVGFFTCGFHIAFLVTHLPGEIALCGLPPSVASWSLAVIGLANIFGSIYAGSAISKYRSKSVLAVMYGSRGLLIIWYLMMPPTEWVFYVFAAGLGFTWLATVPPTASVVAKLFGTRYLATLFGLTLLSHQIGGFLGAWLGGISISRFGDFTWMWYADIALALIAAAANLPIREQPIRAVAQS